MTKSSSKSAHVNGSEVDDAISDLLALHDMRTTMGCGLRQVPRRLANSPLVPGSSSSTTGSVVRKSHADASLRGFLPSSRADLEEMASQQEARTSEGITRHFSFLPIEVPARRKSALGPALGVTPAVADIDVGSPISMSRSFSQDPYMALVTAGAPPMHAMNPWRAEPPNAQPSFLRGRARRQSAVCHQSASTLAGTAGSQSSAAHACAAFNSVGGISLGDGSVCAVGRAGAAGGVDHALGGFVHAEQLQRFNASVPSAWTGRNGCAGCGGPGGGVDGGEAFSGLLSPTMASLSVTATGANAQSPLAGPLSVRSGSVDRRVDTAAAAGVCMRVVSYGARGSMPRLPACSYIQGACAAGGPEYDASAAWVRGAQYGQQPQPLGAAVQGQVDPPHPLPHPPPLSHTAHVLEGSSAFARGSTHSMQLYGSSTPLVSSRVHPSNALGLAALGGKGLMTRRSTFGGTAGPSPPLRSAHALLPMSPAAPSTAAGATPVASGSGGRGRYGHGLTEAGLARDGSVPYITAASSGLSGRGGGGSRPSPSVGPFSSLRTVSRPTLASQLAQPQARSFTCGNTFLNSASAAPERAGLSVFEDRSASAGRYGVGGGVGNGVGVGVDSEHSSRSQGSAHGAGGGGRFEPSLDAFAASRDDCTGATAPAPGAKPVEFRPFSRRGGASIRAFHLAWSCLFLVLTSYFSPAAMLPVMMPDLRLSKPVAAGAGALSLLAGLVARLPMGVWVRRYGPRYCQAVTLLLTAPALACMALVESGAGLIAARFAIALGLGIFVTSSFWLILMFHPSVLGAATAACLSWGSAGSGLSMLLMPLLYELMLKVYGGDVRSAWRAVFYWPAGAHLALGALTLLLGQDTPHGDLLDWDWAGDGLDGSSSWGRGHKHSDHNSSNHSGSRRQCKNKQEHQQEAQNPYHQQGGGSGGGGGSGRSWCSALRPVLSRKGGAQVSKGGLKQEPEERGQEPPAEDASVWGQQLYLQRLRAGSASLRGWGRAPSFRTPSVGPAVAASADPAVASTAVACGSVDADAAVEGVTTRDRVAEAPIRLAAAELAAPSAQGGGGARSGPLLVRTGASGTGLGSEPETTWFSLLHSSGRVRQAVAEAREADELGAGEIVSVRRLASRSVPSLPPPPQPPSPPSQLGTGTTESPLSEVLSARSMPPPPPATPLATTPPLPSSPLPYLPPRSHLLPLTPSLLPLTQTPAATAAMAAVPPPPQPRPVGRVLSAGIATPTKKRSATLHDDERDAYQQWRCTRMRQHSALGAGWHEALHLYGIAVRNYRCLLLALNYGYNFGAQMALYNVLTVYLVQQHGMRFVAAGALAAMPGLLNVAFRASGTCLSGLLCRRFGMRGRLWLLWGTQTAGGMFCLLLGQCSGGRSGLAETSVLLLLFALASQTASGTHLTIAPYVSFRAYSVVLNLTSAGGQLGGALLLASFFMSDELSYQEGLRWMGVTIMVVSTSLLLLRFPMWGSMLAGPDTRYGGVQEEQYYLQEWTLEEQQCGLAAAAVAFAKQARSERSGWDCGMERRTLARA